jgi:hypothetical protein
LSEAAESYDQPGTYYVLGLFTGEEEIKDMYEPFVMEEQSAMNAQAAVKSFMDQNPHYKEAGVVDTNHVEWFENLVEAKPEPIQEPTVLIP